MKLRIYTDLHLFSPMYDGTKISKIDESYFIGDIIDFASVKKSDYKVAQRTYENLVSNARGWIDGNHERISLNNDFIKVGKTMMVHGDFEAWGEAKAFKYRHKDHCAGFLKRKLWVPFLKRIESIGKHKPSKDMINELIYKAHSNGFKTIIAGHNHPKKTYDKIHGDIRVIVLKRGLTEIEV